MPGLLFLLRQHIIPFPLEEKFLKIYMQKPFFYTGISCGAEQGFTYDATAFSDSLLLFPLSLSKANLLHPESGRKQALSG
jgi:hypothetical protein